MKANEGKEVVEEVFALIKGAASIILEKSDMTGLELKYKLISHRGSISCISRFEDPDEEDSWLPETSIDCNWHVHKNKRIQVSRVHYWSC